MSDGVVQAEVKPGMLPPMSPLREVWTIAWPTVLAMTSYTVMQFTDQLMVGQVGPDELAAQSNGSMWSWTALSFALGILTVVNTFVSQNLGAGTPRNGPRYAWAAIWLGAIVWLFVMIPYAIAVPWMYGDLLPRLLPSLMAGHTPKVLHDETAFAQILVFGSIFPLMGRGMNQFFFGMHRPRIVTAAALIANACNLIGDYILIYGHEGLPRLNLPGVPGVTPMGVTGAAVSTVIAGAVECSIPMMVFLGKKMHAELGTRDAWRFNSRAVRDLLRLGWPAAVQWGNELFCWQIFSTMLVGSFGVHHMTASGVTFGYMRLSFMPAIGFSVATNSLVGKYIGAGKPDVAVARTRLTLVLALAWMTTCAAVFVIFRKSLIGIFIDVEHAADAEAIIAIGSSLMICMAVFQTFDAIGVIYSGALRGAGDTVWPGVLTVVYSWVFIVAGGLAMIHWFPQWTSIGPWIAAAAYIILFGLTMWWRFAGGKWRSIRLLDRTAAEAAKSVPVMPGPPVVSGERTGDDLAEAVAESRRK